MLSKYSFRSSALEKEKTLELISESLIIHQENRNDEVKYDSFKSLRLYYDPSRYSTNKYQCEITLKNGATILLKSVHYNGPANFEDRGKDYLNFIHSLHANLHPYQEVVFLAGNKPGCFSLNVVTFVLSTIVVGIALFNYGSVTGTGIVLKLIIFCGLMYWGIKYLKRNRPKSYNPEHPPLEVLPH